MNHDHLIDSRTAWIRLAAIVALATLGGVGMWSVVVALPHVQAEFGVSRAGASLPYTLTMLGFGAGGILMGRLADRFGVMKPVLGGALALSAGYVAAGLAPSLTVYALAQGILIGMLGASTTFGPLMADASLWFRRRRGIAVALAAAGNYLAGAIWPPILTSLIAAHGWRTTHIIVGIVCLVTMLPLAFLLRARAPGSRGGAVAAGDAGQERPLGLSRNGLTAVLCVAGVACCVAMAMPQVHIVAYCGDLGYGPARGAEMLSVMLGTGVISRLASGWISDRIGGTRTLLIGSAMQCLTLLFYLPFNGLTSLYIVSALFGLSQGGIVPSYAMIVRERFPANEAGGRVGLVIMATIVGMAVGGWMSGAIFDMTSSYQAAFLNGILWNLVNVAIAIWLLRKPQPRAAFA